MDENCDGLSLPFTAILSPGHSGDASYQSLHTLLKAPEVVQVCVRSWGLQFVN